MKGSVGDMLDYSKELSEKRAESNGGVDPVKQKYFKNYEKKNGVKHVADKKTTVENKNVRISLD